MSKLSLETAVNTKYGSRAHGFVKTRNKTGGHKIPVTYRKGHPDMSTGVLYVLATGLGGKKNSMRKVAHAAARLGHDSLAFCYTNTNWSEALNRNVDDFLAVVDAVPADKRRRVIALSMSGRVVTRALERDPSGIEAADLVAPAGFIQRGIGLRRGARGLLATTPEVTKMVVRHPREALHLGLTTVKHFTERGVGIAGETWELSRGSEHELVPTITGREDAPRLSFYFGEHDLLLPAPFQKAGAEDLGFDIIVPYPGGHMDLVDRLELSEDIIGADDRHFAEPRIILPSGVDAEMARAA